MANNDGIRRFWAFGLPKSTDVKCKQPNWLMDTNRVPKKKEFKGEITEMNGYTSFHTNNTNSKTTTAFLKAKECQSKINHKREARKIKLIDFEDTPVQAPPTARTTTTKVEVVKCKAINLNNKPCGYKATCGDFCKRHAPH
jgi:hypothetical protein